MLLESRAQHTHTHTYILGAMANESFQLNYGLKKTRSRCNLSLPDMKRKLDCIVKIVFFHKNSFGFGQFQNYKNNEANGSINVVASTSCPMAICHFKNVHKSDFK